MDSTSITRDNLFSTVRQERLACTWLTLDLSEQLSVLDNLEPPEVTTDNRRPHHRRSRAIVKIVKSIPVALDTYNIIIVV